MVISIDFRSIRIQRFKAILRGRLAGLLSSMSESKIGCTDEERFYAKECLLLMTAIEKVRIGCVES